MLGILTTASRDVSLAPNSVPTLYLAAGPDEKEAFVTDNLEIFNEISDMSDDDEALTSPKRKFSFFSPSKTN